MPDLTKISVGTALYVCGRMRATKYTAADGSDKFFYEVMANRIKYLDEVCDSQQ